MIATMSSQPSGVDYHPGSIRERWLGGHWDDGLRKRVTAMASAAAASLQA